MPSTKPIINETINEVRDLSKAQKEQEVELKKEFELLEVLSDEAFLNFYNLLKQ